MREGECFLFMFLRFSQLDGEVISQMVTSIKHDCRCCGGGYRQVHWAQMQQVISSYSNMLYSENNLSYGYTPARCHPTSPNIHISVFINKLKFLFALTLWATVIYHRNITGAVLTYCAQRYCRGASIVVIWWISQDSVPAVGQLVSPFIAVHRSLLVCWVVRPVLGIGSWVQFIISFSKLGLMNFRI